MRTEIIKRELFTFGELSDEAKENAISELSNINVEFDWWDSMYEDAENIGLRITEFDLDRNRHAIGKFINGALFSANKIIEDHGKDCETYNTAEQYLLDRKNLFTSALLADETEDEDDIDTEEIDDEFLKSLLEDYSIMLQKECDYLQSEEAIIETIQANEYEFTVNGKLANHQLPCLPGL